MFPSRCLYLSGRPSLLTRVTYLSRSVFRRYLRSRFLLPTMIRSLRRVLKSFRCTFMCSVKCVIVLVKTATGRKRIEEEKKERKEEKMKKNRTHESLEQSVLIPCTSHEPVSFSFLLYSAIVFWISFLKTSFWLAFARLSIKRTASPWLLISSSVIPDVNLPFKGEF